MAYVSSDFRLPAETHLLSRESSVLAFIARTIPAYLHRHWIYHSTVAELHGYSQRDLQDIGAHRGTHEFARRAAGFHG